jgi:uncharacterized membrane protein
VDVFFGEWLNLLIRWAHMVVAIGWIGTSFYFMALDYTLAKRERMNPGVLGTAWQVHGGGFYHVEKYTVAPAMLPDVLHWFKWEAYLTWITGFGLLIVQYYFHAEAFLIDPGVMPLEPWQAIAISVGSLAAGWFIYDGLCRTKLVGENTTLLALSVFALILIASVLYTKVFSGRGAFIHVGALVGTIMAVNVFGVIVPNQKKMIAQMIRGEAPDPRYGEIGKQRSIHNNYLTLPVLLMMVSQHYPFLFTHPHSWLIVALIIVIGALVRHMLNRVDAGDHWGSYGWTLPIAAMALITAIYVTAPAPRASAGGAVTDAQAQTIVGKHCLMCHARNPSHPAFKEPPKNVSLETVPEMRRFAPQIYMQTVQNRAMPLGNQTGMTEGERDALGRWVNGQK